MAQHPSGGRDGDWNGSRKAALHFVVPCVELRMDGLCTDGARSADLARRPGARAAPWRWQRASDTPVSFSSASCSRDMGWVTRCGCIIPQREFARSRRGWDAGRLGSTRDACGVAKRAQEDQETHGESETEAMRPILGNDGFARLTMHTLSWMCAHGFTTVRLREALAGHRKTVERYR